jgi:ankyrin repeat protein
MKRIILIVTVALVISGCAAKTSLIKVSESGNSLAVEKLINEGANINEPDSRGYTPLMYAVWSGKNETVKVLINRGADVNRRALDGYTPLLGASYYGFFDIAKLLIDKGADVNARSDYKSSPLMLATAANNDELSKLLINKGADVNAQDDSGETALHLAESLVVTQCLLDKNPDTSIRNAKGWTALRKAVYEKKIGKVALIRKKTNWQEGIYP